MANYFAWIEREAEAERRRIQRERTERFLPFKPQEDNMVRDRFQVVHPEEGFISSHRTRGEAQQSAECWATSNTGYVDALAHTEVYDAMARMGQPELYRWVDGYWRPAGCRQDTPGMSQADGAV